MNSCDQFQAQLLEYLYDLLESEDRQTLAEHLAGCPACQAGLAKEEGLKKMLAVAAKSEFPGVRFQMPSAEPVVAPTVSSPRVLTMPRKRAWVPWAIAAGIVIFVVGVGAPVGIYMNQRYQVAKSERQVRDLVALKKSVDKKQVDQINQSFARVKEDQIALEKLRQEHGKEFNKLQKEIGSQELHVAVSTPPALQAGAKNEVQVEIRNQAYQPAQAPVEVVVRDKEDKAIYTAKDLQARGPGLYVAALPPDLPLKPGAELTLEVNVQGPDKNNTKMTEKLSLIAPVYLTHLTTDKPMYQPGETVHFRSLTLERYSLKPVEDDLQLIYTITKPLGEQVQVANGLSRLIDEKTNNQILGPDKKPVRGIGAGEYVIDPEGNGGEFTLAVTEALSRFPPQQRKFIVNKYQKPQLNKDLEFTKKSYGAGDQVVAACKVKRAEGGNEIAAQPVTATIKVDNQTFSQNLKTDATGGVQVKFQLPAVIEQGTGTLSVMFQDGGIVETIVRPIPLVMKKLNIEFFPEGGDLVAGVPNRVYFHAKTMLDKPAELKAKLVDDAGKVVVEGIETLNDAKESGANQGMGAFSFKPEAGKKYELKIEAPTGIESKHVLPEIKADGVVLSLPKGVTSDKDPIRIVVQNGQKDRDLLIGAYCRGRLLTHQRIQVKKGAAEELDLKPDTGVGGVFRVTVFEEQQGEGNRRILTPLAERLVFRNAAERLNLAVLPDKPRYIPGDKATLSFQTATEKGVATPAILMVGVVDKSVVTLADEKTARAMPTHFFLTTEVRKPDDLEFADFLLTEHPKAAQALDLLLGTQGWRRFAEQNPNDFRQKHKEEADRLLVQAGVIMPQLTAKRVEMDQHKMQQVQKKFGDKIQEKQEELVQAETKLAEVQDNKELKAEAEHLQKQAEDNKAVLYTQVDKLNMYQEIGRTYVPPILMGLAVVLFLACVLFLTLGWMRRANFHAVPYFVAGACALLLFGFVFTLQMIPADKGIFALVTRPTFNADRKSGPGGAGMEVAATASAPQMDPGAVAGPLRAPVAEDKPADLKFDDQARPAPKTPEKPQGLVREEKKVKEMEKREARVDNFQNEGLREKGEAKKEGLGEGKGEGNENGRRAKQLNELDRKGLAKMAPGKKDRLAQLAGVAGGRENADKARQLDGARDANRFRRVMPPGAGAGLGGGGRGFIAGGPRGQPGKDAMFAGEALFDMAEIPQAPPLMVREYAHERMLTERNERGDFTETVYWHPVLVLPEDGKGKVSFELSESVTSFQVLVVGHTLDGRLGSHTAFIESSKPFVLDAKLPIEVTAGDKIDVPVSINNNTDAERQVNLKVTPKDLKLIDGKPEDQLTLAANQRTRKVYRMQPSLVEGEVSLALTGGQKEFTDGLIRTIKVVPEGFPIVETKSDLLEKVAKNEVALPESWIKGTLKAQVTVYPSTLADLQKGLEALLREPGGCFEQTSTSNYPNLLILDYLKESDQANPEVAKQAQDKLARGYALLTGYECPNSAKKHREGFEWFGGPDQGHEALTAYGLMQFRDMARVYDVDPNMVQRTRDFLMSRKDGKGGFARNPRALDTFGAAPPHITNAYIVWAVTESGKDDDIAKELDALSAQAKDSKDPYFLALVAISLINRDKTEDGVALLKKLIAAQKEDGHLDAGETSITRSGGRDLQIETTSLAVLAWIKANRPADFNIPTQKAVKWLGQQRGGYGGYGSTQSTILTLKALIAFTKANKKTAEAGDLTLKVGDLEVKKLNFKAGAEEPLVLEVPEPEKHLKAGKNSLSVEISGKNTFPYTLSWTYNTIKPRSADQCALKLKTKLDRDTASEGETVRLTVNVENKSGKGHGMAVAVIGLPAGLTLPEDMKQLKDLALLRDNNTKEGPISAWEVRGRELVLYWRDMAPERKIEVTVDLICRVPGEYRGPASRAYLYYNADHKDWVEPLKLTIAAKD